MQNTLYTQHAEEFSNTRTAPWSGWNKIISEYKNKIPSPTKVLDLGCGNGRFYTFASQNFDLEKYLGIDYSNILLNIAKQKGGQYLNLDLNNTAWKIPSDAIFDNGFNLIVAFGLQHHFSSFEIRSYFLKQIYRLLSNDGVAIVTYWQFMDFDRYKRKVKKADGEKNFIMGFGQNENARFCHFTDIQEIEELEKFSGLELIGTFRSDGKDNTENIYRIYTKK